MNVTVELTSGEASVTTSSRGMGGISGNEIFLKSGSSNIPFQNTHEQLLQVFINLLVCSSLSS